MKSHKLNLNIDRERPAPSPRPTARPASRAGGWKEPTRAELAAKWGIAVENVVMGCDRVMMGPTGIVTDERWKQIREHNDAVIEAKRAGRPPPKHAFSERSSMAPHIPVDRVEDALRNPLADEKKTPYEDGPDGEVL